MDIVYKFRLTKVIYDQVRLSGGDFSSILRSWDETDYRSLCEYVTQCRRVVPKYVRKLADYLGIAPSEVVGRIIAANGPAPKSGPADTGPQEEDVFVVYLPEDATDRLFFLQKFCTIKKRPLQPS